MSKRLYIETVGCQMNVLDSELVAAALLEAGYEPVQSARQADIILFNTCSVRQHAEDKIYSALGRLKNVKTHRPGTIIGVLGCMAQKDKERIFHRAPHVDLIVGPGQLRQIPALLEQLSSRPKILPSHFGRGTQRVPGGEGRILEVSLDRKAGARSSVRESFQKFDPHRTAAVRAVPHQALVRVMFGCDKFCSYCIVPSVRGPEQSRPADEIIDEVRRLAFDGCLEVTLIGQTVNSYTDNANGRTMQLSDLLARLHEIEGIKRIKFVTNYPKHMTDDLLAAVRDLPKVSPYLHIPAQSGSNEVLKRMKRGYTVEEYGEMLARIRETIPSAAVTSDFIVGFCGETEDDFQQTVDLVRQGRFKNSFIFKYSPRPGTKAAELYEDDVPEAVKRRRNNELLAIQNEVSLAENQPFLNRTVEILVEGPSKVSRKKTADDSTVQLVGRTVCDRIVVFDGPRELAGKFLPVKIEKVDAFTLFGSVFNF
ncbi:MAG: MiaB/RimO family radical SAM methylthiotransferase [Thermoguttaceae bacterium]|jgi:tRNA-2-methylthio-N6-dimethylallyladenosine synthase